MAQIHSSITKNQKLGYTRSEFLKHSSVVNRRNRGIRLEVVARLLGHKTTKLTTHYAKLLDKNIIDEVGGAFGKV